MRRDPDGAGLAVLVVSWLGALLLVPEVTISMVGDPAFRAIAGLFLILPLVVVLRGRGRRGTLLERRVWAAFLALMPTVYLNSWWRSGGDRSDLWIELAGQVVFGGLALLGLRRSPWFLALGIGAHGVLWDLWHHGRAGFIADWYPLACLIVDVGAGLYIASQATAWQQAPAVRDPPTGSRVGGAVQ